MIQKLLELLERLVAVFEEEAKTKKAYMERQLDRTGESVGALTETGGGEELKEAASGVDNISTAKTLTPPDDREVIKKDLDAAGVAYSKNMQTTTLQKLWLVMKEAEPKVLTGLDPLKKYTAEEVRAKSITCAGLASKEAVQEIFQRIGGAKKFTEIPEDKYAAIMTALGNIKK